jgi:peptidylprolyl isomerase
MARRPARAPLAVESLEGRRVLAASVAVGTEIGRQSTPLVRLVDSDTGAVQAQVLAFEAGFKGGARVAMGDLDGDGTPEVLAASGPGRAGEIRAFRQQTAGGTTTLTELVAYRTLPFGPRYTGGVEIACGDVDGDGREDIVTSMSRGGGVVHVFRSVAAADPVENVPYRALTAFGGTFNGGASVAVADLGTFAAGQLVDANTPDNKVEILVSSGPGMRAAVVAYDVSATPRVLGRIEPVTGLGGFSVTSGRADGDAIDDIVISMGRGGGGVTEVFSGRDAVAGVATRLARFQAFSGLARPNAPIYTAAVDGDGDGRIDRYLATQGDAGGSAGITKVSAAGARTAAFSTVAGPLRIASARTFFRSVTTNTGLTYRDILVGQGATPTTGQRLTVHYIGRLADGTVFDSSISRGRPFEFTLGVGQVIAGWDEGLATMKVGGWRKLVIPPDLGYGNVATGNIPANSTLYFDVELLAID